MKYYIVPIAGELPKFGSLAKAKRLDKQTVETILDCVKTSTNNKLAREIELLYAKMEESNE